MENNPVKHNIPIQSANPPLGVMHPVPACGRQCIARNTSLQREKDRNAHGWFQAAR